MEIKILNDIYISEVKYGGNGGPELCRFQSALTRKHERPRRGTETDVAHGLHGRHIWLHSVT